MPFRNPVRVAEDATCIDIISNGRFDLGAGQGYAAEEFAAHCMNRKERSARLAEGVELVRRLWTEEKVTFDGKFTQVKDMTLSPRPVQQPHIPIWMGARAEKAIQRVARMGAHLMATLGPDPAPLYRETLKAHGYDPAQFFIGQVGWSILRTTRTRPGRMCRIICLTQWNTTERSCPKPTTRRATKTFGNSRVRVRCATQGLVARQ